MFGMTLSKGSPLPFEKKELGPDGRPIIGLFYFKYEIILSLEIWDKPCQTELIILGYLYYDLMTFLQAYFGYLIFDPMREYKIFHYFLDAYIVII